MRTHVDWLTFTCAPIYGDSGEPDLADAIIRGLHGLIGRGLFNVLFAGDGEQKQRSRAPYTYAWTWDSDHVTVYASESLNHFTIEISGQGCERLIAAEALLPLLAAVQDRVTRIDIACDIETQTSPVEFVGQVKHKRMQSSGYQKSASGETCYVGSQKSERYARVYRYAEPHPRCHLLRVEHVFRRAHAKVVAKSIVEAGIQSVAEAAGAIFGWGHKDWETADSVDVDLSVVAAERAAGKTVYWLVNSVAPAFRRLCKDGTIRDPEGFLRAYFSIADGIDA